MSDLSVATGIGSMPGTSVAEAVAVVTGELPDLPHLPELPARGAGADMVGRTGALLTAVSTDFALTTVPTGWQISGQVGPDMRRARSWLGEDCDRLEQALTGTSGTVKVQVCGPWTWAAAVEDAAGRRLVRDEGFVGELSQALAAATAAHLADLRRRLPERAFLVQFDEPGLPAVLDGRIPTASGLGRLAVVPAARAAAVVGDVVAAVETPSLLHCCADFPFAVARSAGVAGISWDLATRTEPDDVAEAFESGLRLFAGAVQWGDSPDDATRRFTSMWQRTGLGGDAARQVAVTPACGLATASPDQARQALTAATRLAARLAEDL
ncbi:MAG: hypothetical protein U0R64_05405 [Candidatus Nanopelagicales bacterium]